MSMTEKQREIAKKANDNYRRKVKQVIVRLPADQADIVINKAKDRAKSLGIVSKTGEGSLNGYILALIANDLNIDITTLSDRN